MHDEIRDRAPSFRPVLLAAPTGQTPLSQALARRPDAAKWTMFAPARLEHMRAILSKATIVANETDVKIFESANTHFHIDYMPPNSEKGLVERTRQRIGQLITTYKQIQSVVSDADNEFIETLHDNSAYARAHLGGRQAGDAAKKKIRFCPPYLTFGPMFQTAVIVHEGAHYVDSTIAHFASELPAPNGSAVDSGKNYAQLVWDEARRNAYSYAQFALHSVENRDRRLHFPTD